MTGEHINTILGEFCNLNKLYFISTNFTLDAITNLISKVVSSSSKLNFI